MQNLKFGKHEGIRTKGEEVGKRTKREVIHKKGKKVKWANTKASPYKK